jgi:hypothetical protein
MGEKEKEDLSSKRNRLKVWRPFGEIRAVFSQASAQVATEVVGR